MPGIEYDLAKVAMHLFFFFISMMMMMMSDMDERGDTCRKGLRRCLGKAQRRRAVLGTELPRMEGGRGNLQAQAVFLAVHLGQVCTIPQPSQKRKAGWLKGKSEEIRMERQVGAGLWRP